MLRKKKKSVLFVFSDDVIETFTEDPSKSARIGGVYPLLLGRGRAESEVCPEKRCHRSSLARSHSTLLSFFVAAITPESPSLSIPPFLSGMSLQRACLAHVASPCPKALFLLSLSICRSVLCLCRSGERPCYRRNR